MPDLILASDGNMVWNSGAYYCQPIEQKDAWSFPVGRGQYPPERWYVATHHDPTGVLTGGYKHTGIDINLDMFERGDVERRLGLAVYSLADGIVHFRTEDWYGNPMIVVKHMHDGAILYTRYAHIIPTVIEGEIVHPGDTLGAFADWRTGDHLHLDMTTTEYTTEWFTPGMVDPVTILQAHLDPARVDEMVKRG